MVANDSRVVRARLTCSTEGAPFEVLLLAPADSKADPAALVAAAADNQKWAAMARTTDLREGLSTKVEGPQARCEWPASFHLGSSTARMMARKWK